MTPNDKHKHPSAEELFLRLQNSDKDFEGVDDLDDFQKEALQGYSQITLEKARSLNLEIDNLISQKVIEPIQNTQKTKIVWFMAAASFVILFGISIIIFNSAHKATLTNNLALNNDDATVRPLIDNTPLLEPVMREERIAEEAESSLNKKNISPAAIVKDDAKSGERNKDKIVLAENNESLAQSILLENHNTSASTQPALEDDKKSDNDKKPVTAKEEQGGIYTMQTDAVSILEEKSVAQDEQAKKMNSDEKNKEASKQKVQATGSATASAPVKNASAGPPQKINAYYNNENIHVLETYLNKALDKNKNKNKSQKAFNTAIYKINLTVFVSGKVKVNTVNTEQTHENAAGEIKDILNAMKNWIPASNNGISEESTIDIVLTLSH